VGPLAILSAFGLSGAAGLNAYIPLLLVGVFGKLGVLQLAAPFDIITHTWALVTLSVLLVIEVIVDKVPGADHGNDRVQTFVRPSAGALLFAANSGAITQLHPAIPIVAGLFVGFGFHATKAAARPLVNASTLGFGAPLVSLAEDAAALVGSLVAILLPIFVLFFIAFFALAAYWVWSRRRAVKSARIA
jgi:uncharacterized protein DUF4126